MIKKATKNTFGVFSISIGLLFGILPFVPGILLIIFGLELLGLREATFAKIKSIFKRRSRIEPVSVSVINPITPDPV